MGRTRVQVKGSIGKAISTGGNSTTVNNTTVVQQVNRTTGGVSGGISSTIWPLIGQIPTPVLDLAALSAAGLVAFDGTDVITRTLSVASADIVVTNGTGAAGNPTIDLGTSVKAALALAATAVQPARTITAGSGLTGGGDLSVDRTIALDSTSLADLALAASAVQPTDFASSSAFGVVQVDGTTITAVGGVISSTGGGGSSPLTTKGDLYGYNTTDARIPVGTDGQVLTADSSAALGVSYQTIGGTGTVTSVGSGAGLSGGPITTAGSLAVDFTYSFAWTGTHLFETTTTDPTSAQISTSDGLFITGGSGGKLNQWSSAAPTDAKTWRSYVDGTAGTMVFGAVNDAYTVENIWLEVARSGDSPTLAILNTSVKIGNLGSSTDPTSAEVSAADAVFITGGSGSGGKINQWSSAAPSNQKVYRSYVDPSTGDLVFGMVNDAYTAENRWMLVTRTGASPNVVEISGSFRLGSYGAGTLQTDSSGNVTVSGGGVPATIADLLYWFQADAPKLSSGSTYVALQNSDPACQGLVAVGGSATQSGTLNSKGVALFAGGTPSEYLLNAAMLLEASTVFAVVNPGSLPSNGGSIISGPGGCLELRIDQSPMALRLLKGQVASIGASTTNLSGGTWAQFNSTYDGTNYAFRIAQTAAGSGSNAQTISVATNAIGYDPGSGAPGYLVGSLAELIVYQRVLTSTEIMDVEAYLNTKWGV